jgi:hypothetical protein
VIRVFLAVAIVSASLAIAPEACGLESVDLNVPGNLDAIEREHSERFAKIQRILSEVPLQPPNGRAVATWMRTQFDARNVSYTDFIMTSFPPKKRLEFSLDNTAYFAVVTLTTRETKSVPVTKAEPAK